MKPAVAFVWENFGPYHIDRLEAAGAALGMTHRVIGIEIAGSSGFYAWDPTAKATGFERVTLFPDLAYKSISAWRRWRAMLRACVNTRAKHVFLCNVPLVGMFLLALALRLLGCRIYAMTESKLDDKPRSLWFELLKKTLYLPYCGAIVGGPRHAAYMRFLGFKQTSLVEGYDTVSGDRVRRLAGMPPAPAGVPYRDRHFTIIARLVPKKNIAMALQAYAVYRREAAAEARDLFICGSGELEQSLRQTARDLGLPDGIFRGFIQAPDIARVLAFSLALILPSTEEQWGLVVNEAVAMGVPILCSTNIGARDLLVRAGVNGFLFESDNPAGLAYFMRRLASDEDEWRAFAEASLRLAPLADARHFGAAVLRVVRGEAPSATGLEHALSSDLQP